MKSQNGSAHVIIVVILVVALLGALGFVFWQNFIYKAPKTETATTKTSDTVAVKDDSYVPVVPSGWTEESIPSVGVIFAIAPEWMKGVEVKKFSVNDNIPLFQDINIVYASYSEKTKSWGYYMTSYNSPMKKLTDSQFKLETTDIKAENKWDTAVYYEPGHTGPSMRAHVFVVREGAVYRFSLPVIKEDDLNQDDWNSYEEQYKERFQTVIKDNVPLFIKTITFKES